MERTLNRFQVIGLHGSHTMDVRLADNKLVLVGENGTGKSTFVNLMYYFLTKQWNRLHEYQFERLQATFGDQELVLTPEHLQQHIATRQHLTAFIQYAPSGPRIARSAIVDQLMAAIAEAPEEDEAAIV